MSRDILTGVCANVAVNPAYGGPDGINFGAVDGILVVGITYNGTAYFVALSDHQLDTAADALADAMGQITMFELRSKGTKQ